MDETEGDGEERSAAARPAETRVLPTPVLAPKMAKVGVERGTEEAVPEEWRRRRAWWRKRRRSMAAVVGGFGRGGGLVVGRWERSEIDMEPVFG
jgi:hypothetical protein